MTILVGCGPTPGSAGAVNRPDKILGSLTVGAQSLQFYVDFGADSAVLGFSTANQAGQPRYFPMYCSTYRGLPAVTLDVFLSEDQQKMWVLSSWKGYETLAYHRIGSDRCTTRYGENAYFTTPTPPSIGGGGKPPAMDPSQVKKVLTITYPK
jgi:hypothetical protein